MIKQAREVDGVKQATHKIAPGLFSQGVQPQASSLHGVTALPRENALAQPGDVRTSVGVSTSLDRNCQGRLVDMVTKQVT